MTHEPTAAMTDPDPPRDTDLGNARRFVADHGRNIHYVPDWRRWLTWDERRWAVDETGEVWRLAKATIRGLHAEAGYCENDPRRRELAKHALRSESEPAIRRMVILAQSEAGIAVLPKDFDHDLWLLNTLSGTVDLRTGTVHPHRREDLITKITAAPYDPGASHPQWDTFLARVLPDKELRAFVQRVAGYALTGDVSEEKLFFGHGPTASGKSTLLTSLRMSLGDYAAVADFETFCERRHEGPREDIARLAGARLVVGVEVKDGTRLAEGLIKWLSGGDVIAARRLYERTFEFKPQFKILLAANHRPRVRDDDEAFWRRILEIPFLVSIPEAERDPRVKATLCDPAQAGAAILGWAVAGALAWQRSRLGVPPMVTAATNEYRRAMDPLQNFLADCCVLKADAWISAQELRDTYERWARENGTKYTLGGRVFADRLRAHGCKPGRRDHGRERGWHGVCLRDPLDPDPGDIKGDRVTEGDATLENSLYARAHKESYGTGVTSRHPSPDPSLTDGDLPAACHPVTVEDDSEWGRLP